MPTGHIQYENSLGELFPQLWFADLVDVEAACPQAIATMAS
jgi:hypothetical protein